MPLIYVTESGSNVGISGDGFSIKRNGKLSARKPQGIIDQFVIGPNVEISRNALGKLADIGIPVAFIDDFGRIKTRLVPPWKHNAIPRIEQAKCCIDTQRRLKLAKAFVVGKMANQAYLLNCYTKNYTNLSLKIVRDKILSQGESIANARDIETLMGIEGVNAKRYWDCFGELLNCEFCKWNGRNRRPPKDPINATLSYSYAVLSGVILTYLELNGLDPYIGYLHSIEDRKPALALDMIEAFRSIYIDRLVLKLFNRKQFKFEDFVLDGSLSRGVFLSLESRKLLIRHIYETINECDECLNMKSVQSEIIRDIERFKKLAIEGCLETFVPYVADPQNKLITCLGHS